MERFFEKFELNPETGCWIWQDKPSNQGYGRIQDKHPRRLIQAHVLSYEIFIGPIPPGKEPHHTCENKICVNPNHLEALTRREHLLAHRRNPNTCMNGHVYQDGSYAFYKTRSGGQTKQCKVCQRERLQKIKLAKAALAAKAM
jgi:hypothetical protein